MTNEEVERAIDFLLRSQANSEARIEQTNEQLNRLGERVARVTEGLDELRVQLGAFADTQTEMMGVMTRTLDAQVHINESLRAGIGELAARQSKTEEALMRLADAQAQSERRLDALTKIVEEERGGR
jgi:prefoldin subunit 5